MGLCWSHNSKIAIIVWEGNGGDNMASAVIIVIDGFQVQVCDCGTVDVTHQAARDTLSTGSFSSLLARTAW